MKIFISYSWDDYNDKVAVLIDELPTFLDIWIDRQGMSKGDELDPEVKQAIDSCHVFLVFLSKTSVVKKWIEKEVTWAFERHEFELGTNQEGFSIIPVLLDQFAWESCPASLAQLKNRLHINATNLSENNKKELQDEISETLFRICAEWIGRFEPAIARKRSLAVELKNQIFNYQEHLFRFVATLNCPLVTLATQPAQKELKKNVIAYNESAKLFLPWFDNIESEISHVFGDIAVNNHSTLQRYIKNEIHHGVAYELNNIIESIHAYQAKLESDSEEYEKADSERESIIELFQRKLDMLKIQIDMFVNSINY